MRPLNAPTAEKQDVGFEIFFDSLRRRPQKQVGLLLKEGKPGSQIVSVSGEDEGLTNDFRGIPFEALALLLR